MSKASPPVRLTSKVGPETAPHQTPACQPTPLLILARNISHDTSIPADLDNTVAFPAPAIRQHRPPQF